MSSQIVWKTLPQEHRRTVNYGDLWGKTSTVRDPIVSVPHNVLMPQEYEPIADKVLNFDVRQDDIWIITYPKC